jgi:hypothetical protein
MKAARLSILILAGSISSISGCGGSDAGGSGTGGSGSGGTSNTGGTGTTGAGGSSSTGGTTGTGGSGSGGVGTGGVGTGGAAGAHSTGSGGATGTGGVVATGGVTGTGGVVATGGVTDTGGTKATGGVTGTGGIVATGGVTGTGGIVATGGVTGTGGVAGSGSAAGKTGGTGGAAGSAGTKGTGGMGGAAGVGGKAGTSGNVCTPSAALDCSSAGALKLPDGQIADFSSSEWNATTATWCNPDGLGGTLFSYSGATPSAATVAVDTTAQNLKLNLTVGATGYAGGGLTFNSCVNAASFTSVQFTAAIAAGSLTNCTWQVQLQTQDQRDSAATNPSGGTCDATTTTCYRYPAVAGLTAPTAVASTYRETFTLFTNPASSTISTPTQVTGVQWQVNSGSSGAGTCTVELRIDNVIFR